MAKGGNQKTGRSTAEQSNPEVEERKRLRKLAVSKNLLSESPAKASSLALNPSNTVIKHHGKDILRKSNRKNRFLFSFPGLLAPVSGGKLGELKDLGSKNPILYLDFPQGRMKLFGTIVYPKNRYLTLQFSRGGKNVMCEDYFDTMIVFSDAWWIGSKEENPEELQLSFPENMNVGQEDGYDFKGGAGSTSERTQGVNQSKVNQSRVTEVKHQSPVHELDSESLDSENDLQDLIQTTATRHSTRTSGKTFKFAESSSADDAFDLDNNTESSGREENEVDAILISGNATETEVTKVSEETESSKSATKSKEASHSNKGSLVQATISTLFKKKEEKMTMNTSSRPTPSKVSRKKVQEPSSEEKVDQSKVIGSRKKGKAIRERKTGTKSMPRKKKPKVSDDEVEEISDPSQDSSDEDWGA